MTADDIIAANPECTFRRDKWCGRDILLGNRPDGGEFFVVWQGHLRVECDGKPTPHAVGAAIANLEAMQTGKEFRHVGDDEMAARLRASGVVVMADKDGDLVAA